MKIKFIIALSTLALILMVTIFYTQNNHQRK